MRATISQEKDFCEGCPLYADKRHRSTYLPTDVIYSEVGEDGETPKIDLLVVGGAPGRAEDSVGLPFAGQAGRELRSALAKAGVEDGFGVVNAVRCRPVDAEGNNRPPTVEEIAACSNYLVQDLKALNPKVVVLLGDLPLKVLNKNPAWKNKKINSIKGQVFHTEDGKVHLATIHPKFYLRTQNQLEKRRFGRHIRAAARLVDGKETAWSRIGKVEILDTIEKFDKAIDFFMNECTKPVAFDFETKNVNHVAHNKIATLQFSADPNLAYVVPVDHWDSPWNKEESIYVKKRLRRLFRSSKVKFPFWIAHNSKFDIGIVMKCLKLPRLYLRVICTMYLAYLQDENLSGADDAKAGGKNIRKGTFALKNLVREHLGFYYYDTHLTDALAARSGASGGSLWDLSLDRLSEYGGTDAYITYRLFFFYRKWLKRQGYTTAVPFADKWYGRVAPLLTNLSRNGLFLDTNQLEFLRSDDSPIISRLEAIPDIIYATPECKKANSILLKADPRTKGMKPLFGKKPWLFNINKPQHLIHLFVDSCRHEPLSVGKSGKPSIDKAFKERYKDFPLISLHTEYKGLQKLKTSYLDSIEDLLESNPDNSDRKIHASFFAERTVTGRLSSAWPNLQQAPKGDPWTAKAFIRSLYGAPPGYVLVECDYGQAEVRWWAQIAGDKKYAKLFIDMKALRDEYRRTGDEELGKRVKLECDIHKKVAALMFQLELDQIDKATRQKAKALVFGSIFGQHVKTLAALLQISVDEAGRLQDTFINEFSRAGKWLTKIERSASLLGYTETPHGRRRHLSDHYLIDENGGNRRARNSPIQAASSDTTLLAACNIQEWIDDNKRPYKIVNCVHDAITIAVPLNYASVKEITEVFQYEMVDRIPSFLKEEFGIDMIVPMEIDFDIGVRWGHMLNWDGVEAKLAPIVKQCEEWDRDLASGTPWFKIASEYKDFQEPVKDKAA